MTDLKKLAEVKRWNAGDLYINDEVVKIEDHKAAITTLLQDVETLRGKLNDYRAELKACQERTGIYARHEEAAPQGHPYTDACGFDRNASLTEDTYVCTCGYRGETKP